MAGDAAQDDWIRRVLGIDLAGAPATGTPVPSEPFQGRILWRDAKEEVDARLDKLAAALRDFEDPDLDRIAEFGLFGLGTTQNVTLIKALTEYEAAAETDRPNAAKALRVAVGGYRALLDNEPVVALIDRVPLSQAPAIRATLGAALDEIEAALP